MENRKEQIQEIYNFFGKKSQISKCREELAELIVKLYHYEDGRSDDLEVISELADSLIMLSQMVLIFGEKETQRAINHKLKRTLERIESGYYRK